MDLCRVLLHSFGLPFYGRVCFLEALWELRESGSNQPLKYLKMYESYHNIQPFKSPNIKEPTTFEILPGLLKLMTCGGPSCGVGSSYIRILDAYDPLAISETLRIHSKNTTRGSKLVNFLVSRRFQEASRLWESQTPGIKAKKPTLTLNLGTNGLKVTSEPPPMAGQAGCLQGQDRSAVTYPSRSHARRCLIWLSCDNRRTRYTTPLAIICLQDAVLCALLLSKILWPLEFPFRSFWLFGASLLSEVSRPDVGYSPSSLNIFAFLTPHEFTSYRLLESCWFFALLRLSRPVVRARSFPTLSTFVSRSGRHPNWNNYWNVVFPTHWIGLLHLQQDCWNKGSSFWSVFRQPGKKVQSPEASQGYMWADLYPHIPALADYSHSCPAGESLEGWTESEPPSPTMV
ncbi:hypothetical protein J6590_043197 [Homalodisca vitripennis]|nr:hypothetical protein J6590_043197 [Homalodisca vitripennis]